MFLVLSNSSVCGPLTSLYQAFRREFVIFSRMYFCKSHETFRASCVSPEAALLKSSAREANFACEQKSHYGEEDGEDEEHIRGADHCVVGQLVRLASHLVNIEAYGEDECRHAEQDHWKEKKKYVYSSLYILMKCRFSAGSND